MSKVPPSKKRYDKKHPVISVRLTKELKEILDRNRIEESYSDLIKLGLEKAAERLKNSEENFDAGYEAGLEDAEMKYRIWYYCSICGEEITIKPNSDSHKSMIEHMKKSGWGHAKCHEKKS